MVADIGHLSLSLFRPNRCKCDSATVRKNGRDSDSATVRQCDKTRGIATVRRCDKTLHKTGALSHCRSGLLQL